MSRIGMRMLTSQHVELFGDHGRKRLTIVDENCDIAGIVRDAAENAKVCFVRRAIECTSGARPLVRHDFSPYAVPV
jgi:hypothetical protein